MVIHISLLSHKYTKNKKAVYPMGGRGNYVHLLFCSINLAGNKQSILVLSVFFFLKSITTSSK